jgi:hypothetical protein
MRRLIIVVASLRADIPDIGPGRENFSQAATNFGLTPAFMVKVPLKPSFIYRKNIIIDVTYKLI